jgi:hypothetical protein
MVVYQSVTWALVVDVMYIWMLQIVLVGADVKSVDSVLSLCKVCRKKCSAGMKISLETGYHSIFIINRLW